LLEVLHVLRHCAAYVDCTYVLRARCASVVLCVVCRGRQRTMPYVLLYVPYMPCMRAATYSLCAVTATAHTHATACPPGLLMGPVMYTGHLPLAAAGNMSPHTYGRGHAWSLLRDDSASREPARQRRAHPFMERLTQSSSDHALYYTQNTPLTFRAVVMRLPQGKDSSTHWPRMDP
jgi:hypothetical protein